MVCDKLLPYLTKVKVDEKREHTLTNFRSVKKLGRVTETDHNKVEIELNMDYSKV